MTGENATAAVRERRARSLALLVAAFGALLPAVAAAAASEAAPGVLSARRLEERHGIKIVLIGVTAAGGLVDLRLEILDRAKASRLLRDGAAPKLVALPSGRTLTAPEKLARGVNLRDGGHADLLYPNVRGAIRPGTPVSVQFGGVRVAAIAAR